MATIITKYATTSTERSQSFFAPATRGVKRPYFPAQSQIHPGTHDRDSPPSYLAVERTVEMVAIARRSSGIAFLRCKSRGDSHARHNTNRVPLSQEYDAAVKHRLLPPVRSKLHVAVDMAALGESCARRHCRNLSVRRCQRLNCAENWISNRYSPGRDMRRKRMW